MAIEHKFNLSTTEPTNNVGVIKVRQSDDQTQLFQPTILKNNSTLDLTGYKAFFMLRTETTTGIVEQEAKIIDAKNGRVDYTLNKYDWQKGGKNTAYFSFRKLNTDNSWKEQFTTRDFVYTVTHSSYSNGISDSNYVWTFEDLLRLLNEFKESGMTDFNEWFETIKDTLGEDAAGELAMALLKLQGEVDLQKLLTNLNGDFFRRLRNTDDKLTIACFGDSLTYGYDVNSSDIRPADETPTDDGTMHTKTRASVSYPESLQEFFDLIYPGRITIKNMGFAGDTTKTAYAHWYASGADLVIFMLGTNDANKQSITDYTLWYRKLINRELENGSSVVILTPPKRKLLADKNIATYRNASIILAKELNVPCVDMVNELANIDYSNYSDTTHFNGKGYRYLASRVFAIVSGESILNPVLVGNKYLSVRDQIDGFMPIGSVIGAGINQYPTPADAFAEVGAAVVVNKSGTGVLYTFKTTEDNVVVYPSFFCRDPALKLKLSLDFGLQNQSLSNANMLGEADTNFVFPSEVIFNEADLNYVRIKSYSKPSSTSLMHVDYHTDKKIIIPKAGYHTIKIESLSNSVINFFGLYCTSLETYSAIAKGNTPPRLDYLTNKVWDDGVVNSTLKIKLKDLQNVLRTKMNYKLYGDNPTLKITIKNYDKCHLVYYVQMGRMTDGGVSKILDAPDKYVYNNYSGNDYRNLTNVEWETEASTANSDEALLCLEFGGNITKQSFISIELG